MDTQSVGGVPASGRRSALVPNWLKYDCNVALGKALALGLADIKSSSDSLTARAILSVLALAKGELKLGAMLSQLDDSELDEWIEHRVAWSELYNK
ncbi:MAG TPA: hypothetical protein VF450_06935 [Noviherbaspirillum sp.]